MKLAFILFFLLFAVIANAQPLKTFVVFGDSLSDTGNLYEHMQHKLPKCPPYYDGRFSNGPLWVEHLVAKFFPVFPKKHLLNYAYGGAGVSEDADDTDLFTFKREIDSYLLTHLDKASDESLFVIWMGANNYIGVPDDMEKTLVDVNTGIYHGLQRLITAGAKHFLILNLPDLGKTPIAHRFGSEAILADFTTQHNQRLANTVAELQGLYPETQWFSLDINTIFNEVLASPQNYGFSNITDTCYDLINVKSSPHTLLQIAANPVPTSNACDGSFFFDPIHPTTLAHEIIANYAANLLRTQGAEF